MASGDVPRPGHTMTVRKAALVTTDSVSVGARVVPRTSENAPLAGFLAGCRVGRVTSFLDSEGKRHGKVRNSTALSTYLEKGLTSSLCEVEWDNRDVRISAIGCKGLYELAHHDRWQPDADYHDSDSNNRPWGSNEWWHADDSANSATQLLVVFSGLGLPGKAPTFIFYNFLRDRFPDTGTLDRTMLSDTSDLHFSNRCQTSFSFVTYPNATTSTASPKVQLLNTKNATRARPHCSLF